MSDGLVLLTLTRIEAAHLAQLVDDFRELVAAPPVGEDPAVARLTPDAYPGDAEASAAFAESTRAELLDRREQDAVTVRRALGSAGEAPETEDEAMSPVDIAIPDAELPAWLRTIAALRLIIASRLGIADEHDADLEDPRFGVYSWLGSRLEGLVAAAESNRGP